METVRQILTSQAAFIAALAILTTQYGAGQAPAFTTLYSFQGGADGKQPTSGVILGTDGVLYGTTYKGGTSNSGTVFSLTPGIDTSWTHTVLLSFNGSDGQNPSANLVFGSNGALYGTTLDGGSGGNGGTVFELTPPGTEGGAWNESVLYSFSGGCDQRNPYSALLIGSGGSLYGTTFANACITGGGAAGGTAFLLAPPAAPGGSWTEDVLLNLDTGSVGNAPFAGLVHNGGSLYGTTYFIGDQSCGDVFELSPPATAKGAWIGTAIHTFVAAPTDGCGPTAALTVAPGGVLYGTTLYGGSGATCYFNQISGGACGTVFQLTPPPTPGGAWAETVLYNFTGLNGDGAYPYGGVTLGKNGILYGTTEYGGAVTGSSPCSYYGAVGCGAVFKLTPPAAPDGAWTETILHSFTYAEGAVPTAGLTASSTGVLYGTTSMGGASQAGTVFSITP